MRLGFIGLGEAGATVAMGAAAVGMQVYGYDPRSREDAQRDHFASVASSGVEILDSIEELAARAPTIFCLVTPNAALRAAEQAAPALGPEHRYVDANSVSPGVVSAIAERLAPTGAVLIDAAVMAAVPSRGHHVPMLLSGTAASELCDLLVPFGFEITVIGERPGAASAAKMVRSVVVKGTEALLVEAMAAASRYGVTGVVLDSLDESFPEGAWRDKADYFASRTIKHARRRAVELDEAAAALGAVGVAPLVTAAAARRLRTAADAIGDRTGAGGGHRMLAEWMTEEPEDVAS